MYNALDGGSGAILTGRIDGEVHGDFALRGSAVGEDRAYISINDAALEEDNHNVTGSGVASIQGDNGLSGSALGERSHGNSELAFASSGGILQATNLGAGSVNLEGQSDSQRSAFTGNYVASLRLVNTNVLGNAKASVRHLEHFHGELGRSKGYFKGAVSVNVSQGEYALTTGNGDVVGGRTYVYSVSGLESKRSTITANVILVSNIGHIAIIFGNINHYCFLPWLNNVYNYLLLAPPKAIAVIIRM